MAKKQNEEYTQPEEEVTEEGTEGIDGLDFDVNDEYKASPLIPGGTYHGSVIKVVYEPAKYCIVWTFSLHDNGGVMSDGETPIDGAHVFSRNWLPKPGDETEMTGSGRNTKRQSKINMLMDFQNALGIDMSTPKKIGDALSNAEWIGVEADLTVTVREWEGRFSNDVSKVTKSRMY